MRHWVRAALLGAALIVASALAYPGPWLAGAELADRSFSVPGLAGLVTILRDAAGFAHVRAETTLDAYAGLGFAMAADRSFQMQRRARLGRVASGPPRDGAPRTSDAQDELLEAFAAGVNGFLEQAGTYPSPEHRVLRMRAPPWAPEDALHALAAAAAVSPGGIRPCADGSWLGCAGPGSVAVAAARSATGGPLLSVSLLGPIDPLPSYWYAAQLQTPDGSVQGLFVPGTPVAVTGRGDAAAWHADASQLATASPAQLAEWSDALVALAWAPDEGVRDRYAEAIASSGTGTALTLVDADGIRRAAAGPDGGQVRTTRAARTGLLPLARSRRADGRDALPDGAEPLSLAALEARARDLQDLDFAADRDGLLDALAGEPGLATAAAVLEAWDGRCDRGSRGCALFEALRTRLDDDLEVGPDAGRAAEATRATLDALNAFAGPDPDAWNWGSMRMLELRSPAAPVPLLGRWFRRGPFALEGCPSCAWVIATPPGEGLVRHVTVGVNARFVVDLSEPGAAEVALPTASAENPFRRSGQPVTDAWLAGRLHTLSLADGARQFTLKATRR